MQQARSFYSSWGKTTLENGKAGLERSTQPGDTNVPVTQELQNNNT